MAATATTGIHCVHLCGRKLLFRVSRPHSAMLCKQERTKTQWKKNDIQEVTWLLTKYSTNILLRIHCWQCLRLCVLSLNHQPTAGCFLHHTVNIKIQTCMCFIYGLVAYLLPVFRLNLAIIILLYWALHFVSWQCCALLISQSGMAQPTQLRTRRDSNNDLQVEQKSKLKRDVFNTAAMLRMLELRR